MNILYLFILSFLVNFAIQTILSPRDIAQNTSVAFTFAIGVATGAFIVTY